LSVEMKATPDLDRLYAGLGQLLGIGGLRGNAAGSCRLVFDEATMVEFQPIPARHQLMLSCRLALETPPAHWALLLQANAWQAGSAGGWFALDPQSKPLLQMAVSLLQTDARALLSRLESLLDAADMWSRRLQAPAATSMQKVGDFMMRI